jgi:hypothetical protein
MRKSPMTDFLPKPGIKVGGLSRKAQKLQALRDKAAAQDTPGVKAARPESSIASMKATKNSFNGKKTPFQRKAV